MVTTGAGGVGAGAGADIAVFLLVGLLGGAHCLGMCGPLVTLYAERLGDDRAALSWHELRQHALFNGGRTVSYALIGGTLGAVGGVVFETATVIAVGDVVRGVTGVLVGVGVVGVGIGYLLGGSRAVGVLERAGGPLGRAFGAVMDTITDRIDAYADGPGIVGLGMLHGFLPCPILYPAFLYAFAAGSAVHGALALGTLGLGTFPTLFLYGTVIESVSPTRRRRLHRGLGAAFVLLGYIPLSGGLLAFGIELPRLHIPIYQPL